MGLAAVPGRDVSDGVIDFALRLLYGFDGLAPTVQGILDLVEVVDIAELASSRPRILSITLLSLQLAPSSRGMDLREGAAEPLVTVSR